MGATRTLLTFEEFERLPDKPGKRELRNGELLELPVAGFFHDEVSQRLFLRLHAALETAHVSGSAVELGSLRIEAGHKPPGDGYAQPEPTPIFGGAGNASALLPGLELPAREMPGE